MQFPFFRAPIWSPRIFAVGAFGALAIGLGGWATAQTSSSPSLAVTSSTATSNEPISLAESLRLAQSRSYSLLAQDSAAQSAREMAVAAGQLPDPILHLALLNLPVDGTNAGSFTREQMTKRGIGVTQTFTREGKRKARAASFERSAEVAQSERIKQLTHLRRETALAWFDRYYQQQMVGLLRQQHNEASLQTEAAEAAYRGGRGTPADVFMARSAVAQSADRLRQADARLNNAITTLTRWIGDRATAPLAAAPAISHTRIETQSLEQHFNHHPGIALMASKEAQVKAEAELAKQEKRADWSVDVMYNKRGPGFSSQLSVALSVPLQWNQKNRQDRELTAKLLMADQLHTAREEMIRQHLAETQRWLQTWHSNLERMADYDKTLIPLAAERTQAALASYRAASGSLSAVLEARRIDIDTRMERLRIEMETADLWATLEYLIPVEFDGKDAETTTLATLPYGNGNDDGNGNGNDNGKEKK
jgi:cobalt-zinc-cadmium efflux system outer membrane protein